MSASNSFNNPPDDARQQERLLAADDTEVRTEDWELLTARQPSTREADRLLMAQAGYFQDIAPDNRDRDRVEEKI
jgi:hypothetical protein